MLRIGKMMAVRTSWTWKAARNQSNIRAVIALAAQRCCRICAFGGHLIAAAAGAMRQHKRGWERRASICKTRRFSVWRKIFIK